MPGLPDQGEERRRELLPPLRRAYSLAHADRADKSATAYRAAFPGRPEYYEKLADTQWDPHSREMWRAEAAKARARQGNTTAHAASLIVKASGVRTLREAWRQATDPRAQAILRDVMDGRR